jgi:hypothetical protein
LLDAEPIYSALFARLKDAASWRVVSRQLRDWDKLHATTEMPALFMTSGAMTPAYRDPGTPPVWTLRAWVYIYVAGPGTGDSPDQILLKYLGKVTSALARQTTDRVSSRADVGSIHTNLGGLVLFARVGEDGVKTDEGGYADSNIAVAYIPIEMQVVE